jgi:hypothetical protein
VRMLAGSASRPATNCSSAWADPGPTRGLNDLVERVDAVAEAEVDELLGQYVAPGVTINPEDNSYGATELTPSARRRGSSRRDIGTLRGFKFLRHRRLDEVERPAGLSASVGVCCPLSRGWPQGRPTGRLAIRRA